MQQSALAHTAVAPPSFSPPPAEVRSPPLTPPPPAPVASQNTEGDKRCPVCNSANAAGLRYCMTCGSQLQRVAPPPAIAPPPVASATPAPPPPAAAHQPMGPPAPIAPMRVVDLGAPGSAAPQTTRVCARCKGNCDSAAQFCKFCGASLVDGAPSASPNGERAPAPHVPVSRAPTRPESPTARKVNTPQEMPVAPPPAIAAAAPAPSPSPIGGGLPAPPARPVIAKVDPLSPRESGRAPSVPPPAQRSSVPAVSPAGVGAVGATATGRIVVIGKDGREGPSYPLADQVDIGRTEGNIVVHDDRYLSLRHARITRRGGKTFLRDLGSVNGVYLRLAPRQNPVRDDPSSIDHPLEDQDLILVGQQVIRFEVVKDAEDGLGVAMEQDTLLFGTPASPRFARLDLRTVEGVTRDVFYVRKSETVLGRESGDIVFTEDPFLSRRHCVLRRDPQRKFQLTDLGSSNGTFVKIRGEVELKNGDQFRIGQQLFRVDFDASARRA